MQTPVAGPIRRMLAISQSSSCSMHSSGSDIAFRNIAGFRWHMAGCIPNRMSKKRLGWREFLFFATIITVLSTGYSLWHAWFYKIEIHREMVAPHLQRVAFVTIRNRSLLINPVVVAIRVCDSDGRCDEKDFRVHDSWVDITQSSYPLMWKSDSELIIGNRNGTFSSGWNIVVDAVTHRIDITPFTERD